MDKIYVVMPTSDSWGEGSSVPGVAYKTRESAEKHLEEKCKYDMELYRRYGSNWHHEEIFCGIKDEFGDDIEKRESDGYDDVWFDKVLNREVNEMDIYYQLHSDIYEVELKE